VNSTAFPTIPSSPATLTAVTHTTLSIDGMSCGQCVAGVTKALSGLPGIEIRSVSVGSAQIITKGGGADSPAVRAALASLAESGYAARAAQPAAVSSPGSAAKMGGCCGGNGAASASAKPSDAGGTASCCG